MQELPSRLKEAVYSAREKLATWYNADEIKPDCDCTILGSGCRKRDCLARTLSPTSYCKKLKRL